MGYIVIAICVTFNKPVETEMTYLYDRDRGGSFDVAHIVNAKVRGSDFKWDWYIRPDIIFSHTTLSSATPLQIAAWFGESKLAELLIKLGASVESMDDMWKDANASGGD